MNPLKTCVKCSKTLPINCFHKRSAGKDGHRNDCKECSNKKNNSWYYNNKKRHAEYGRAWRKKNSETAKKYNREYYARNSEKERERKRIFNEKYPNSAIEAFRKMKNKRPYRVWSHATLSSHRRRKIEINITVDDLENLAKNSEKCLFCGIKMRYGGGNHRVAKHSATLDRIDNEKHMDMNNIQIICHSCNTAKGTMAMEEYIDHCKMIAKKFG